MFGHHSAKMVRTLTLNLRNARVSVTVAVMFVLTDFVTAECEETFANARRTSQNANNNWGRYTCNGGRIAFFSNTANFSEESTFNSSQFSRLCNRDLNAHRQGNPSTYARFNHVQCKHSCPVTIQPLSNGDVADQHPAIVSEGSEVSVTYVCETGYEDTTGNDATVIETCPSEESVPINISSNIACTRIHCAVITANNNISSSATVEYEQQITYQCDDYFRPQGGGAFGTGGTSAISSPCAANGLAVNIRCLPAYCRAIQHTTVDFAVLASANNVTVQCSNNYGVNGNFEDRSFVVQCTGTANSDDGYVSVSDESRIPTCQRLHCDHSSVTDENVVILRESATFAGEWLTLSCIENFGVQSNAGERPTPSYRRECVDEGPLEPTFRTNQSSCTRVNCGPIPWDPNAAIVTFINGSTLSNSNNFSLAPDAVRYTCIENHAAVSRAQEGQSGPGSYRRLCSKTTAQYTNDNVKCRQVKCRFIGTNRDFLPANSVASLSHAVEVNAGANLTVTCSEFRGVSGSNEDYGNPNVRFYNLQCNENGSLTGPPGDTCKMIRCPTPSDLENATPQHLLPYVLGGENATYQCQENYNLVGSTEPGYAGSIPPSITKKCNASGQLDPPVNRSTDACARVYCGAAPLHDNAVLDSTSAYANDTIRVTCNEGFVFPNDQWGGFSNVSAHRIMCRPNGTYSSLRPCVPACDTHRTQEGYGQWTNLSDGSCHNCTTFVQDAATQYKCRSGFVETQECGITTLDRTCTPCGPGLYAPFNPGNIFEFASTCARCSETCLAGQYVYGDCTQDSHRGNPLHCEPCSPGMYSTSTVNANNGTQCDPCGQGWYCSLNGTRTSRLPCAQTNQYQNTANGTACLTVDTGFFSIRSPVGSSLTVGIGQVECQPGYMCIDGRQIACTDTQYTNESGAVECQNITDGYYTSPVGASFRNASLPCERGYFCRGGMKSACGPNTYTNREGLSTCTDVTLPYIVVVDRGLRVGEILCPPEMYCTEVSLERDYIATPCPVGHACPGNTHWRKEPCVAGSTFAEGFNNTNCSQCRVCGQGIVPVSQCTPESNTVCSPLINVSDETIEAGTSFQLIDDRVRASYRGVDLTCNISRWSDNVNFIPQGDPNSCECCGGSTVINTTILGNHTVYYEVLPDQFDRENRTVQIVDREAPVFNLTNAIVDVNVTTSEKGDPSSIYMRFVSANDTRDHLLGFSIDIAVTEQDRMAFNRALGWDPITSTPFNWTRMSRATRLRSEGYILRYSVQDTAGNRASSEQTFRVHDNSKPVMLIPSDPQQVEASNEVRDLDQDNRIVAEDFVDGFVNVSFSSANFRIDAVGNYTAYYWAEDLAGNVANHTVTVRVVDTTPPTIQLRGLIDGGQANYNSRNGTWTDPGYTVSDNLDTPVSLMNKIQINFIRLHSMTNARRVELDAPLGTVFVVSYNVSDMAHNVGSTVRTVTIADLEAPSFVSGVNSVENVTAGQPYNDRCPFVTDNVNDEWAFPEPECVDVSDPPTQFSPGKVYRVGLKLHNDTLFANVKTFTVMYYALDNSSNIGLANRTFVVLSAAAESASGPGLSAGESAGTAIVVLLLLGIAVAVAIYYRRARRNGTQLRKAHPPPPEPWYHGNIDRKTAEDRLLANGDAGSFLVRSKAHSIEDGGLVISVLGASGSVSVVHYTLSFPRDTRAAVIIQGVPVGTSFAAVARKSSKPVPGRIGADWGCCLPDIIEKLRTVQPNFRVTVPLLKPVEVSSKMADLAHLFEPVGGVTPSPQDVYQMMTANPGRFDIGSAYRILPEGLFYRIFQAPNRLQKLLRLYTIEDLGMERHRVAPIQLIDICPWHAVYVKVEPEELPAMFGVSNTRQIVIPVLHHNPAFAPSNGFENESGPSRGKPAGWGTPSSMYKGKQVHNISMDVGDVVYSSVNHGGSNGIVGVDVVYSAIHHNKLENESGEDVVYSSVQHENAVEPTGDVLYTSLATSNPTTISTNLADNGVVYSAVQHAPPSTARVDVLYARPNKKTGGPHSHQQWGETSES